MTPKHQKFSNALVFAVFVLSAGIIISAPFLANAQTGLVTCGTLKDASGKVTNPCSACDIFVLITNLLNFIWYYMAIPLAALMFGYGGFLMIVPGIGGEKSAAMYAKGKKVLTNALIGLAIIFFAWIAVDSIIKLLVGQSLTGTGAAEIKGFGPWNKIECNAPASALPQQPPSVLQSVIPPEIRTQTQTIIPQVWEDPSKNTQIKFSTDADCRDLSGTPVSAKTTIDELAARQPVTVCQSGCKSGKTFCQKNKNVTVSPTMLAALDSLRQKNFYFTMTSLTTGDHISVSCHYSGNCADLVPAVTTLQGYETLRAALAQAGGTAYCETKSGTLLSSCLSVPAGQTVNHIHVSF